MLALSERRESQASSRSQARRRRERNCGDLFVPLLCLVVQLVHEADVGHGKVRLSSLERPLLPNPVNDKLLHVTLDFLVTLKERIGELVQQHHFLAREVHQHRGGLVGRRPCPVAAPLASNFLRDLAKVGEVEQVADQTFESEAAPFRCDLESLVLTSTPKNSI